MLAGDMGGGEGMEKIKLLPCPFCGGQAVVNVNKGVRVICTGCFIKTETVSDYSSDIEVDDGAIESVVDTWNRRVNKDGG